MNVVADIASSPWALSSNDVLDPPDNIVKSAIDIHERSTINCYSSEENMLAREQGGCIPITDLKLESNTNHSFDASKEGLTSEVHTIDLEFSGPPQPGHFVRFNDGLWLQHENPSFPMLHPEFKYDKHAHPNHAMLNVPSYSSVILIWRTKSLMDHPMHLHGYKMEILAIEKPDRKRDCNLSHCKLNTAFNKDAIANLDRTIPRGISVLKDTFILPAGGAVVTRIHTEEPALWFAHCHLDFHKEDGMAFVLNVGNYRAPVKSSWLPEDYPSCDTPFIRSKQKRPACECYINKDAILGNALTKDHRCSRNHLCYHELSQAANLDSYKENGFRISSDFSISSWSIGIMITAAIFMITWFFSYILPSYREKHSKDEAGTEGNGDIRSNATIHDLFRLQFIHDWKVYQPTCTNQLRVLEVTGESQRYCNSNYCEEKWSIPYSRRPRIGIRFAICLFFSAPRICH